MKKLLIPIAIGGGLGILFAGLISAAGVMAGTPEEKTPIRVLLAATESVLFPEPAEPELLKLGDDEYLISAGPGVSLVPTATSTVRKIGHGDSNWVTISTTSSGVYSSDGLRSNHVIYPGIDVRQVPSGNRVISETDSLAGWSSRHGFVPTPTVSAGSFAVITRDGDVTIMTTPAGTCVMGPSIAIC